jgi:hypothetical protein
VREYCDILVAIALRHRLHEMIACDIGQRHGQVHFLGGVERQFDILQTERHHEIRRHIGIAFDELAVGFVWQRAEQSAGNELIEVGRLYAVLRR